MAKVFLTGDLRKYTAGVTETEVQASSYRAALVELRQQFPGLTAAVMDKFSVAIDGVMIHSPLLEPLQPDSELVFIPRIAGG